MYTRRPVDLISQSCGKRRRSRRTRRCSTWSPEYRRRVPGNERTSDFSTSVVPTFSSVVQNAVVLLTESYDRTIENNNNINWKKNNKNNWKRIEELSERNILQWPVNVTYEHKKSLRGDDCKRFHHLHNSHSGVFVGLTMMELFKLSFFFTLWPAYYFLLLKFLPPMRKKERLTISVTRFGKILPKLQALGIFFKYF